MSTLPSTALLLTNGSVVLGHFDSYMGIGCHMGISINDDGVITFNGSQRRPHYVLDSHPNSDGNGFTPYRAMSDWCVHHMADHMPRDYSIYRYLNR